MSTFVRPPRGALDPPAAVDVTGAQRRALHMMVSLLLDYPHDGELERRLDAVAQALPQAGLPEAVSTPVHRFLAAARQRGQRALAEHYVETFDRRRRCCLYLSYYAVGDTRHRGAAILAFQQALAATGWELDGDELADYLPVVLELSARSGDEIADELLASHRDGIEVLRAALVDAGSPYADLIEAVSMTLPPVDEEVAARIRALVSAGPPTETVGVTDVLPFPTTIPDGAAHPLAPGAPLAAGVRPDPPLARAQEASR